MNNFNSIYKRLYSFCAYNLFLYANLLLLFVLALNITIESIVTISKILFPAYLLVGIGGYFLNDLFDEKQDFLSKKFNFTRIINKYLMVLTISLFWFLGFYLIHSLSKNASFLLVIQFLLLCIYSVPGIRLKEKGLLGLVTDAFYAHVIPAIILLNILQEYTAIPVFLWISFSTFSFLLGMRDITIHQLEDLENDIQSNTQTFAVKNLQYVKNQIDKLNILSALSLCIFIFLIQKNSGSILFFSLFIILTISYILIFYKFKKLHKDSLINNYIIISAITLSYLLIENKNFGGIVLLLHPYFIQKIRSSINYIWITILPLILNYSLYYFFFLLGRNLKKNPLWYKRSYSSTRKTINKVIIISSILLFLFTSTLLLNKSKKQNQEIKLALVSKYALGNISEKTNNTISNSSYYFNPKDTLKFNINSHFEESFHLLQQKLRKIDTIHSNEETKYYIKSIIIADFVYAAFSFQFLGPQLGLAKDASSIKNWNKLSIKKCFELGNKNEYAVFCGERTSFFNRLVTNLLKLKTRQTFIKGIHTFPLIKIGKKEYIIDPYDPFVVVDTIKGTVLDYKSILKKNYTSLSPIRTKRLFGSSRMLISQKFYNKLRTKYGKITIGNMLKKFMVDNNRYLEKFKTKSFETPREKTKKINWVLNKKNILAININGRIDGNLLDEKDFYKFYMLTGN